METGKAEQDSASIIMFLVPYSLPNHIGVSVLALLAVIAGD